MQTQGGKLPLVLFLDWGNRFQTFKDFFPKNQFQNTIKAGIVLQVHDLIAKKDTAPNCQVPLVLFFDEGTCSQAFEDFFFKNQLHNTRKSKEFEIFSLKSVMELCKS